ncbi:MAG: HD domain-containing protein [Bacillota bacterium]
MTKKHMNRIIAGIDIGSHALRMKIVEVDKNGEIKTLEQLRHSVALGRDTYATERVSFEAVDETCEILKGFKRLMNGYHIKNYRAAATSAIREAQNRDYIVDQIKLKTGFDIDVLSNAEERFLTYKAIRENLKNHQQIRKEGGMVIDIGAGSIEASVYRQGSLVISQNIRVGSLRIREVLSDIEERTLNFAKILEEYIESNTDRLKVLETVETVDHFIGLGGEIQTINQLCSHDNEEEGYSFIHKKDFLRLYDKIIGKSTQAIVEEYGIAYERADVLLPSMIIFKKFMDMTNAKGIHAPMVSLKDGIVADLIDREFPTKRKEDFYGDILSSTRFLAKRYLYDQRHADDVEEKSLVIFDGLKKLHGLGDRERLLLQLSAILHDIGKFINFNEHYIHSYQIIMASEILGISQEEMEIIANISRYHSKVTPRQSHENFSRLSEKNKVVTAKLIAIIRLADALDRSHRQKIKDIQLQIEEKDVIIKIDTDEDVLLEQWTFETKSEFFQEVFGYTPILKTKRKVR